MCFISQVTAVSICIFTSHVPVTSQVTIIFTRYSTAFFIGGSFNLEAPRTSKALRPPGCDILYYTPNAQLFLQLQVIPHRANALFHYIINAQLFLWPRRVFQKEPGNSLIQSLTPTALYIWRQTLSPHITVGNIDQNAV